MKTYDFMHGPLQPAGHLGTEVPVQAAQRFSGFDAACLGLLCLALLLAGAVLSDLRARRIPNILVVFGLAAGLALHTFLPPGNGLVAAWPGGLGPWAALQGLAIGAAAMFPLYFLGALGAGDVKLMAAVGCLLGPADIVPAILATFIAGGVVSLAMALALGAGGQLIRNLSYMAQMTIIKFHLPGMRPQIEPPEASVGRAPYALAIALGTVGGLLWSARAAGLI